MKLTPSVAKSTGGSSHADLPINRDRLIEGIGKLGEKEVYWTGMTILPPSTP
jgi:hypothetical protein